MFPEPVSQLQCRHAHPSSLLPPGRVHCLGSRLLKPPQCPFWGISGCSQSFQFLMGRALLGLGGGPEKDPSQPYAHCHWAPVNRAMSPWPSSLIRNITKILTAMVPSVSGLHSPNHHLFQEQMGCRYYPFLPPCAVFLFKLCCALRTPLSLLSHRIKVLMDSLNVLSLSTCYVPALCYVLTKQL